jgi:hypothetical protein
MSLFATIAHGLILLVWLIFARQQIGIYHIYFHNWLCKNTFEIISLFATIAHGLIPMIITLDVQYTVYLIRI